MHVNSWQREAHLYEAGAESAHASRLYELAARDGTIEPLVRWAMSAWREREALADATVQLVASRAPHDDCELQFALYQAYELGISTGLDLSGRLAQRFHHMRLAAIACGHPRILWTVACHYWHGLNEVPPDEAEAEHWFALSAQSGDPEILRSYTQFKRRVQPVQRNPSSSSDSH